MSPAKSHKRDAISGSVFPREILAANVRARRALLRLSQNDIAERMSSMRYVWSRPTVSQVERAARPVSVDELYGLALALGVSVVGLLAQGEVRPVDVGLVDPIPPSAISGVLGRTPPTRTVLWLGNRFDGWNILPTDEELPRFLERESNT